MLIWHKTIKNNGSKLSKNLIDGIFKCGWDLHDNFLILGKSGKILPGATVGCSSQKFLDHFCLLFGSFIRILFFHFSYLCYAMGNRLCNPLIKFSSFFGIFWSPRNPHVRLYLLSIVLKRKK